MKRAVIIGASAENFASLPFINEGDFVIAADGGLSICKSLGITPNVCVGDYDSVSAPVDAIILPAEKDVTDIRYAVDYAINLGFTDFLLAGCTGGRLDHFLGNLFLLEYLLQLGFTGSIIDSKNQLAVKGYGSYVIEKEGYKYLSVLALSDTAAVTLTGFRYPLENYRLKRCVPLGISNEITDFACITVHDGIVAIIKSSDNDYCDAD